MNDYTIKFGDTLSTIAAKNGMSLSELKAANPGIENANSITAGQKITIPLVDKNSVSEPMDHFEKSSPYDDEKETTKKEPWQNLEQLIKNGKNEDSKGAKITAQKGFLGIKTGTYNYTADGTMTFGQLKEQLGLEDNVIRDNNQSVLDGISGNADDSKIAKGTVLKFDEKDLPKKPLQDKDGKNVEGFSKSILSNTLFYSVKAGDTQESIYDQFKTNKKSLKGYRTADAMQGYPQETLQPGTQVALHKKFLGIF